MNSDAVNKRLRAAAQAGSIDELYQVIRMFAHILEHVDGIPFVDTPLHVAVAAGHIDFAMEIMNLKPSFARKLNQDGYSPLHLALQKGKSDMVFRLLAIDIDLVRVKGREGKTPLHYVVSHGNLDLLAQFLVRCPKCIQDVTIRNETAFHIAAEKKRLEVLQVLVQSLKRASLHGITSKKKLLNWRNNSGNTALHIAASKNQPEMFKLLIESNVSVNKINSSGSTALDILKRERELQAVDNRECMEILCNAGGLNESAISKDPPLHMMLRSKITFLEKAFGQVFHDIITMSAEKSSALLVVLVLILTTTYQATLSPPGGFSGAAAGTPSNSNSTSTGEGKSVMRPVAFLLFYIPNTMAFIISLILTLGLLAMVASGATILLLLPLLLLYLCLLTSTFDISPTFAVFFFAFLPFISLGLMLSVMGQIRKLRKHLIDKEIPRT